MVPLNLASREGRPACLGLTSPDGAPCADRGPAVRLGPATSAAVAAILSDPGSFGAPEARCFLPEQALVWPAEGGAGRVLTLSLRCARVEAAPPLPAQPRAPDRRGLQPAAVAALRRALGPAQPLGLAP
ncbi:MAG: hypothetical protein JNM72_13400 [Deltaproteobacteria bacterium]|nr:hypothetical protein [Deltaproteobacteria bacterium]